MRHVSPPIAAGCDEVGCGRMGIPEGTSSPAGFAADACVVVGE